MHDKGVANGVDDDLDLAQAIDEFFACAERGEQPTIESFLLRFPHVADRLREALPAMVLLKQAFKPGPRPAATKMPRRLGEYELVRELGRGGMGVVYEALHATLRRRAAIKILPDSALHSPDAIARFQREARAAARLNHPNVVSVYDASEADGVHYLVMEYIEGENLSTRCRRDGAVPVAEAIGLLLQAARGLAYAHQHGVVHRDVKPSNLLVDPQGRVKVLDMGLARMVARLGDAVDDTHESAALTQSGQLTGTVDYMAPEQALDSRQADERSDVYSLGCTLYYLISGQPPFDGETLMLRVQAHQQAAVPALREASDDVTPRLEAAFQMMMAKRPGDRFPSMADVATALERCLNEMTRPGAETAAAAFPETVVMPPSSTTVRPQSTTMRPSVEKIQPAASAGAGRRRGRRSALIAAGGGALVLIAGLYIASRQGVDKNDLASSSLTLNRPAPQAVASAPRVASRVPSNVVAPPADVPFTAAEARKHQEAWAEMLGVPVELTNSLGMKFVLVPPGAFTVRDEPIGADAQTMRVRLSAPFYMSAQEVTQGNYEAVIGANPSQFTRDGKHSARLTNIDARLLPVENVSWKDAEAFCKALTQQDGEHAQRRSYRLPTELEWEYAALAGSPDLSENRAVNGGGAFAWSQANSDGRPHAAGELPPNAFGLYNMTGNVWEYCSGIHPLFARGEPASDEAAGAAEALRVRRGGAFDAGPTESSPVARAACAATSATESAGFRVVFTIPEQPAARDR